MKKQEYDEATSLLERYYADIERNLEKPKRYNKSVESRVEVLMTHLLKNKSVVAALFTSLIKKIVSPEQDVRLARTEFEGGYSGRSLDTHVTAPFFKRHFPTYANKESSFLTLATRESIKWTLTDGQELKIRNDELKQAFLHILDDVETRRNAAKEYLLCLIHLLLLRSKDEAKIFDDFLVTQESASAVGIYQIVTMLREHFALPYSSRLPVIALQTAYQMLLPSVARYAGKHLEALKSHTSSDRKSFGDIEIFDEQGKPFEVVEVKHNIPLDRYIIADIVKKAHSTVIQRYYALTTHEPNFTDAAEEIYVQDFVLKIKQQSGLEVIPNGIIPSLKYYLRFIENYEHFLLNYAQNLVADAQISTEITAAHLQEWQKISTKFQGMQP
ncbi:MAG: restriction endonuclease, SacI family [Candidatus Kapabacteria bacterium]|jgi:DNA (cytosine-5)-methyltransferase 1|nr:restriction endonuclease, SacI family [Candidatus Kapabacteria bacterium]